MGVETYSLASAGGETEAGGGKTCSELGGMGVDEKLLLKTID